MSTLFDVSPAPADVSVPPQAGVYQTLMADPPWNEAGGGKIKRGADRHYPLMKTRDICALPVASWAAPDAHCYVWVTNNYLADGLEVLKAWGFTYVTKIDWFKGELSDDLIDVALASPAGERLADEADCWLQMGIGQYFRGVTESCLFGVRGSVPYRMRDDGMRAQGRTGFHAPRAAHSVKPEKFRTMVELVSPGPYLEMFARRPAPGWDVWGNEVLP